MEVLSQLPQTDEIKREQIELVLAMQIPRKKDRLFGRLSSDAAKSRRLSLKRLAMTKRKCVYGVQWGSTIFIKGVIRNSDGNTWRAVWNILKSIQDVELMIPIGFDLCSILLDFRRLAED